METKQIVAEFKVEGEEMTFEGYGASFGNVDSYGDVIVKGAFDKTLRDAKRSGIWPAMLLQHGGGFLGGAEDQTPIGVWTDMHEDDKGLVVKGKLAATVRGQEVYTLMKMTPRPAITGLSIGYLAKEFTLGTKAGEPRRMLKAIDLFEVSCVTFPANGKSRLTSVKAGDRPTIRLAEEALREAGFSRTEAKAILASGFKALPQRDAGDQSDADVADALRRLTSTLTS